jgi:hypothetical protein
MKNLILITSHNQTEEFMIAPTLLKKTNFLWQFDLILHNNNKNIDQKYLRNCFDLFPNANKKLIHTEKNAGYVQGLHQTLSDLYDEWKQYDNVLHLHCDVFVVDENKLLQVMVSNMDHAFVFSMCNPPDPVLYKNFPQNRMISTDIFVIRPKLLNTNVFANYVLPEYNQPNVCVDGNMVNPWCELILQTELEKHNVSYAVVKRFDNESWWPRRPCLWGCWHEHNYSKIKKYL